jgi:putative ATP-dependent endonuclease of the OLD family
LVLAALFGESPEHQAKFYECPSTNGTIVTIFIDKITVKNFRSIVSAELLLGPYTPIVGYNNSGKTNVISALQWLLRKSVLSASDFHDESLPLEVSGHISGITQAAIDVMHAKVQPYVVDECLTIKREQTSTTAKTSDIKLSAWDCETNSWVSPTGIDKLLSIILPEPIRIGAMEDAAEDVTKARASTTIGKLLAESIASVREAHQTELVSLLSEVEQRLSFDGDNRFAELVALEDAISTKIDDLFPGIGARLHFPVPGMDDLIKSGTLKLCEGGGAAREFSSYGHGTQRSVQMALIRHLADVRQCAEPTQGTTLILIDEPELYLHPFAIGVAESRYEWLRTLRDRDITKLEVMN